MRKAKCQVGPAEETVDTQQTATGLLKARQVLGTGMAVSEYGAGIQESALH